MSRAALPMRWVPCCNNLRPAYALSATLAANLPLATPQNLPRCRPFPLAHPRVALCCCHPALHPLAVITPLVAVMHPLPLSPCLLSVQTPECTDLFHQWVLDMATHFKSLDQQHLLTVGSEGGHWCWCGPASMCAARSRCAAAPASSGHRGLRPQVHFTTVAAQAPAQPQNLLLPAPGFWGERDAFKDVNPGASSSGGRADIT